MAELQKEIRIVIPAFNAGNTIQKCVEAVLKSICFHKNWEIIIVDNGLNPDLTRLLQNYPVTILKRVKYQSAAYARNEGSEGFSNGILVFIDSDVICENDCLRNLIKPLQNNLCNASLGNYSKNLRGLSFSQQYKQLYINHIYNRDCSNIKNDFWTAICSVDASVFKKLGGFNSNFKGANGEDQEFGIRLTKYGYNILSVKNANGQHLNPYGVLNIIKNDFKKGLVAVKNSLENKIPLSDNRHSKRSDMYSVIFAVLTVLLPIFSLFNSLLLFGACASFILWFLCRMSISISFYKNAGLFFFLRALTLMFYLDLIRFACVAIGFLKNKLINTHSIEIINNVSIPIKS